jgi:hypothetical protein
VRGEIISERTGSLTFQTFKAGGYRKGRNPFIPMILYARVDDLKAAYEKKTKNPTGFLKLLCMCRKNVHATAVSIMYLVDTKPTKPRNDHAHPV